MKYRSSSLTGDGITMAVAAGAATLRKNAYVMGTADSLEVEKLSVRGTVGEVEQDESGKYKPEIYKLDPIRVRFMAPSTHHTMGGNAVAEIIVSGRTAAQAIEADNQ